LAQLGPFSAKALPLTYAHKLSHRVFDYFRFLSHKDVTNMPAMARKTEYGEPENRKGESFMRFVLEYLNDAKVRKDGKELLWKPSLDKKMFYL
jgi:hypothetical protein